MYTHSLHEDPSAIGLNRKFQNNLFSYIKLDKLGRIKQIKLNRKNLKLITKLCKQYIQFCYERVSLMERFER